MAVRGARRPTPRATAARRRPARSRRRWPRARSRGSVPCAIQALTEPAGGTVAEVGASARASRRARSALVRSAAQRAAEGHARRCAVAAEGAIPAQPRHAGASGTTAGGGTGGVTGAAGTGGVGGSGGDEGGLGGRARARWRPGPRLSGSSARLMVSASALTSGAQVVARRGHRALAARHAGVVRPASPRRVGAGVLAHVRDHGDLGPREERS